MALHVIAAELFSAHDNYWTLLLPWHFTGVGWTHLLGAFSTLFRRLWALESRVAGPRPGRPRRLCVSVLFGWLVIALTAVVSAGPFNTEGVRCDSDSIKNEQSL